MNKLVIAVIAVGIGVWAVAAAGGDDDCGGGGGDSTKNASVRFWIMNNGPDPVGDTEEIIRPFEKKTGIDVKVQLVGWDVQYDRIRNAAVSGEGPDVTQAGTTQVPFFAALGGFETCPTAWTTSAARAPTRPASGRPRRWLAARAPGRCRGSPRHGRSTTARTC